MDDGEFLAIVITVAVSLCLVVFGVWLGIMDERHTTRTNLQACAQTTETVDEFILACPREFGLSESDVELLRRNENE